jgi:hypothetical protein
MLNQIEQFKPSAVGQISPEESINRSRRLGVDLARLVALAADSLREPDIALHDRDAVGVDGAQVGVLEKPDKASQ